MRNSVWKLAAALLFPAIVNSQNIQPSPLNLRALADQTNRVLPPGTPIHFKNAEQDEESVNRRIKVLKAPPNAKVIGRFAQNGEAPDNFKGWNPTDFGGQVSEQQYRTTATTRNFSALGDNPAVGYPSGSFFSSIPPDTYGSAGPNHLMVVLNTQYRFMDKNGVVIQTVDAQDFWKGTAGYYAPPGATSNVAVGHADPHVQFDPVAGRWILIAQSNLDAFSSLLVAVSQTNDPTGTWNRYAIDTDPTNLSGFDYPLLGYNNDWVVVSGNMFGISSGTFTDHQIYIFDKANLYAGGALNFASNAQKITVGNDGQSGWCSPATVIGSSPANTMYLLQPFFSSGGNSALRLSTLTGTIPTVAWNTASAVFVTSPLGNYSNFSTAANGNTQPQKNDVRYINSGDGRLAESWLVNGKLWAAQHVYLPAGGAMQRTAIQWWQLQTDGAILQNGRIDDPSGFMNRTYPSIAVNSAEDVVIGYSVSAPDRFVSAAYATRRACTPTNQMDREVIYKDGLDTYAKSFGGSRVRWGDYSRTSIDPTTGNFWTIQQYADTRTNTTDNGSKWATWWAEVVPDANNRLAWAATATQTVSETGTQGSCPRYKDVSLTLSTQCAATGSATVTINLSGTATTNADYQLLTPSVVFANGETSKTVTVRVFDDMESENSETVVLTYSISGSGVVAASESQTATITITNDDITPVVPAVTGTAILGKGDILNGIGNLPLRGGRSDARCQFIYTAAELSAAGLAAGNITQLSIDVLQKLSTIPYTGFTIRLKPVSITSFATTTFETGTTTVFSANYTPTVGTNTFTFTSPFNWDGTSNLLVEMCYDNASFTSNDQVKTSVTGNATALWNSAGSGTGCTLLGAFTTVSGIGFVRPDIRLNGVLKGNPVQSALVNTTILLGPNADAYVYNTAGEILARIKNNTAFDYGCTQVIIDRAGTGSKSFWNNNSSNFLADKTFQVIPANNNPSGNYTITLYYSQAEVNGWQSATGNTWSQAKVVKVPNKISDVTPTTPTTGISVDQSAVTGTFGADFTIQATFSTGFSGFGVGVPGNSTLPVTLLSFSGQKKNEAVELNWQTSFELNNDYFEVEVSNNGNDFHKLGKVKGKGNSTTTTSYTFTDLLPAKGANYYRLKQVDLDGRSTFSRIIAIVFDGKGRSLLVYPNPTKDRVVVEVSDPLARVEFRVFSIDGRLARTMQTGSSRVHILDVSALAAGSYVLDVRINGISSQVMFVKE